MTAAIMASPMQKSCQQLTRTLSICGSSYRSPGSTSKSLHTARQLSSRSGGGEKNFSSTSFSTLRLRPSSALQAEQRPAIPPATTYKPTPSSTLRPSPSSTTSNPAAPQKTQTLSSGLSDEPIILDEGERQVDWARSFHGLSAVPFSKEAADILLQPIDPEDIEIKPDGIIYLPEIKYRRILNKAFGPGGWGMAPRGETIVTSKAVTREYALVAHGRYVRSRETLKRG